VIQNVQVFPGMFQRAQVKCDQCEGQGTKFKAGDMCKDCNGKTLRQIEEKIMIPIQKGTRSNDKIRVVGKGHQLKPNEPAGNVTFVVKEETDEKCSFKREGDDLFTSRTISLTEALCGFQFNLTHLDGHVVVVKSAPGDIVMDGSTVSLEGEGMQMKNAGGMCGSLIITFTVAFPPKSFFDDETLDRLRAILPPAPAVEIAPEGSKEMFPFVDAPGQRQARLDARRKETHIEDDSASAGHSHGGQQVQCASQ